jgi:hypothetical protein
MRKRRYEVTTRMWMWMWMLFWQGSIIRQKELEAERGTFAGHEQEILVLEVASM